MFFPNLYKVLTKASTTKYQLIKYITNNVRLIVKNDLFNTYEILLPLLMCEKNSVLRDNINNNYNQLLNAYRIHLIPNMIPIFYLSMEYPSFHMLTNQLIIGYLDSDVNLRIYKYLSDFHKYLYPTEQDDCVELPVIGYELQTPDIFYNEDIPKKLFDIYTEQYTYMTTNKQ